MNEKKIIKKIDETFNVEKDYKLFRLVQDILNPTWKIKNSFKDTEIDVETHKVPVRIFPNSNENKKLIIFIHGGGWSSGSVKSYSKICKRLSDELNTTILSIDYKLAPEYPFPYAFNECYDVIKKIYDTYSNEIDRDNITLMGDSAGGNLVAAISQKAKDKRDFKVKQQILFYPTVQMDYSINTKYKSVIENGDSQLLTRKQLTGFVNLYIKNKEKRNNVYAQPILARHLFGLPKTIIIVGSKDPLRDEAVAYSKKLSRHFVNSKYYILEDATHGFLTNILDTKYTNESIKILKSM